ncbi:phosphoprotein phosphatase A [Carpediemonas membranifera]|uniref:Phosphoprotein phosphatase A n=1 Tax=Carpediemonas membranifera TaxID=201153 RepID=A0A8J6DZ27_9EUKA|nr:phosphoprotein phosphatase A [Carpediemonas membranifera]|eukprot:KAG9389876.1 phosphoprotein phosphatase A [Carpediemonas membranifera]
MSVAVKEAIQLLTNDKPSLRLTGIRQLKSIAEFIGPKQTQEELVPYLEQAAVDDTDEILIAIAEELACLGPLVSDAACLIRPLAVLARADMQCIRDAAIASFKTVCRDLPTSKCDTALLGTVERLASSSYYNEVVSACCLIPLAYSLCSTGQRSLLSMFSKVHESPLQIVQRAAADNMGDLADAVTSKKSVEDATFVVEKYLAMHVDDADNIRMANILGGPAVLRLTSTVIPKYTSTIDDTLAEACKDVSWRVRLCAATVFADWVGQIPRTPERTEKLASLFAGLMSDHEAEVRAKAAAGFLDVCRNVGEGDIVNTLLPTLSQHRVDSSDQVKKSTAAVVCGLAHHLTRHDVTLHVRPILFNFLADPSPEVKLNVLSTISGLVEKVGPEDENIRKAVALAVGTEGKAGGLSADVDWHIRDKLARLMPELCAIFSRPGAPLDTFTESLAGVLLRFLRDSVFAVRSTAVEMMARPIALCGTTWVRDRLVPQLSKLSKHLDYLRRITALQAIAAFAEPITELDPRLASPLLDVAGQAVMDKVPNVRLNAALTLGVLGMNVPDKTRVDSVGPLLTRLQSDSDADVRESAEKSIRMCHV